MPRERGTLSIKFPTLAALLGSAAARSLSTPVTRRGRGNGNGSGGERSSRHWPVAALAGAAVLLLVLAGWGARRNRQAPPATESLLVTRPAAPRAGANRQAARPSPAAAAARGVPAAVPVPDGYHVLFTRCVFARDGQAASASTKEAVVHQEGFLLKGISQEDRRFTAFVADPKGRGVTELHVGEGSPVGRVREITLEDVAIEAGGRVVRVQVGQKFDPSGPPSLRPPRGNAVSCGAHSAPGSFRARTSVPTALSPPVPGAVPIDRGRSDEEGGISRTDNEEIPYLPVGGGGVVGGGGRVFHAERLQRPARVRAPDHPAG